MFWGDSKIIWFLLILFGLLIVKLLMLYSIIFCGVDMTGDVVIVVPRDIVDSLRIPPEEAPSRLRIELALRLYEKGIATLGQARRIAGLSLWEFLDLVEKEGISRHYDDEEALEDLEMVRQVESSI